MAVPTVELKGAAVTGVETLPKDIALPTQVKLGCNLRKAHPCSLKLESYYTAGTVPPSTNYRAKAAASLARMYLNDQYGDCVIAGKAHALGIWSANDPDSGGLVEATDSEVLSQYHSICGPGDNGCVITDVLDVMRSHGFQAGGKLYKIDGYVSVDWTNKLLTQTAQYIFGATTIGINLPQAWTQNAVWDVTNTRIVGGHDVTPIDADEKGMYISSWGRVYLMTWEAWLSKKWLTEYYVILAPLWYNNDKLTVHNINVEALKTDLTKLGGGIIPPIDPTPAHECPVGQHWDEALQKCVDDFPPPTPTTVYFTLKYNRAVKKGQTTSFTTPASVPAGTILTASKPAAATESLLSEIEE